LSVTTCNSQFSVTCVFSLAHITGRVQSATFLWFLLVADMVKHRFYIPWIHVFNSNSKTAIIIMLNLFQYTVLRTQLLKYSFKSSINLHIVSFYVFENGKH
jgi:hypothetical protein